MENLDTLIKTFAFMMDVPSMGHRRAGEELLRILRSNKNPVEIFTSKDGPLLVGLIDYFNLHNPNQSEHLEKLGTKESLEILVLFHQMQHEVQKLSMEEGGHKMLSTPKTVKKTSKHVAMSYRTNWKYIQNQEQLDYYIEKILLLQYWIVDLCMLESRIALMQIGNKAEQYLIDTRFVDLSALKARLEDQSYIKYMHSAVDKYRSIKKSFGISLEGILDGEMAEKILTCGRQKAGFSAQTLCTKYTGIRYKKLDLFEGCSYDDVLTVEQKDFAAQMCIYPDLYIPKQVAALKKENLIPTFLLECNAIPAFGDISYYGLLLNVDAWKKNIEIEQEHARDAKQQFSYLIAPFLGPEAANVNPSSPNQVLDVFQKIYPHHLLVDPDKKNDKGTSQIGTSARVLQKLLTSSKNPEIANALIQIRKHEKKIGTYGNSYIDHINAVSGRFHPVVIQLGTDTGRPADRKPNMLTMPKDSRYRTPWIAGAGRKIVTCDYNACELRIMASMSEDPVMCQGFNTGIDYHTFTASRFIKDTERYLFEYVPGPGPGKGHLKSDNRRVVNPHFGKLVPYERVTAHQRDIAKFINFGLAYGLGPQRLSDEIGISMNEAKEYIKNFSERFAVLTRWLKLQQEKGFERGYSETYLGRRRYFVKPVMPWEDEWDKLAFNKMNPFDKKMPDPLRRYHATSAAIKREAGNSPIQGSSADITKIAMYEIRKYIRQLEIETNRGEYLAHVALQVYDEIVIDCPEHLAKHLSQKMVEIMRTAGERVITQVPVVINCTIADTWIKE